MKKKIIQVGLGLVATLALFACQKSETPQLFCVENGDGLWGYINLKGEYVIPPQFKDALPFSDEGLALVRTADKSRRLGFIDKKGRFKIAPEFIDALPFVKGVAIVVKEGTHPMIINTSGKVMRELKEVDAIQMFSSDGLALYSKSYKVGYLNTTGRIVVEAKYEMGSFFTEGLAIVSDSSKFCKVINRKGKVVAEINLSNRNIQDISPYLDGLAMIQSRDNDYVTYVNTAGKEVVPHAFSSGPFYEGLAPVVISENPIIGGLMNKKGEIILQTPGMIIGTVSSGLAPYEVDERFGYLDKKGNIRILPQYDLASPFYGDIAIVKKNEGYGIINKKGEFLVYPKFESIIIPSLLVDFGYDGYGYGEDITEEYLFCESDYTDLESVVQHFTEHISGDCVFGLQLGQGPETLTSNDSNLKRYSWNPMKYYLDGKQPINGDVELSDLTYLFEKGKGTRPPVFPEETVSQPWPMEGIKEITYEYDLSGKAYGKEEMLSRKMEEAMVAQGASVTRDDKSEVLQITIPSKGGEAVTVKVDYGKRGRVPIQIKCPLVAEISILDGAEITPEYVWLVSGGLWLNNPWGYDSDGYEFSKDKTCRITDISGTEISGKYAIVNGTKLLLRNEKGEIISFDLDLGKELIIKGEMPYFAQNGTKYDELMRQAFSPQSGCGFYDINTKTGENVHLDFDYYHCNWSQNGVVAKVIKGKNDKEISLIITQYPVSKDNKYESFAEIMAKPPVRTITLFVKNENQLFDESGKQVATGSSRWPRDGIKLTGKGDDWFLGEYGQE